MKAFIIYIKENLKSCAYAETCLESCIGSFDAELFPGVTVSTLHHFEKIRNFNHIIPSRANNFSKENMELYQTKKCVFYNGYLLWKKCVELNEPIVVLEHDSFCVKKWDNLKFDELLILNGQSCWNQKVFDHLWKKNLKPSFKEKIQKYETGILPYKFENNFYNSTLIPGAAAYSITPKGAKKLIKTAEEYGWEQNDHFLNTENIDMQIAGEEYFTFQLPNLRMSHGIKN